MDNPYSELKTALQQTRNLQQACKECAGSMAQLLVGHLRDVPPWLLRELKKEIAAYNPHTRTWRKP